MPHGIWQSDDAQTDIRNAPDVFATHDVINAEFPLLFFLIMQVAGLIFTDDIVYAFTDRLSFVVHKPAVNRVAFLEVGVRKILFNDNPYSF